MSILAMLMVFSNLTHAVDLKAESYCYDEDKAFKACRDQKEIFEAAVKAARSKQKAVLVVYGFEACPWSQSILKVLNWSSAAAALREGFVIVPIAVSKFNASGHALLDELAARFKQSDRVQGGVPKLIVFNPKIERGEIFSLADFERNTPQSALAPAYHGFEAEQVLKRLSEVGKSLDL